MNEDSSIPCKHETHSRFIKNKVEHQAKLKKEITHDDFLNVLLENIEKKR